jgi:hypothetical protein
LVADKNAPESEDDDKISSAMMTITTNWRILNEVLKLEVISLVYVGAALWTSCPLTGYFFAEMQLVSLSFAIEHELNSIMVNSKIRFKLGYRPMS